MSTSNTTLNHEEIKKWAESRNGRPAIVKGTENNEDGSGLLRIVFEKDAEENLQEISWGEFFETFDMKNLAFLYQDKTADNKTSRFFKFVKNEEAVHHK